MSGTIFSGTYTNGIVLSDPATQNPATVTATGYITNTGSARAALYGAAGFAWTVTNYGAIEAYGGTGISVELASGGSFTNEGVVLGGHQSHYVYTAVVMSGGPAAVANFGTISGRVTISGGPGAIVNYGYISGYAVFRGPGTVANYGAMYGLQLSDGGSVANVGGGYIAQGGVHIGFGPAGYVCERRQRRRR